MDSKEIPERTEPAGRPGASRRTNEENEKQQEISRINEWITLEDYLDETRNSSWLPWNNGDLRMWKHIYNKINQEKNQTWNLLEMPPLFHREAETGWYRRKSGEIQETV